MGYSAEDLAAVEQAIRSLAEGERVVAIEIGGRRVEYARADLDKLRSLRAEMIAERQAGSRRFVLTSTSKGLW